MEARQKMMSFGKQWGVGALVLLALIFLVHDTFGKHGYLDMKSTVAEIKRVNIDRDRLDKENAELQEQVKDLKSDPETIMRMGRESGLSKPGERIIKLPQAQWSTAATLHR